MGALDDAIREHLELKRRHGASDEEIRRAETEALGPARRDPGADPFADEGGMTAPFDAFADEPAPQDDEFTSVLYDDRADDDFGGPEPSGEFDDLPAPLSSEAVEDAPPPPVPDDAPDETPATSIPQSVPLDPAALNAIDEPLVEAEPPGTPKPHGDPFEEDESPSRAETHILDDVPRPPIHHEPGEDEPPAPARPVHADEPEDEDVLEETPEFLQDTPDHERLWFEQKPPRDFDLD